MARVKRSVTDSRRTRSTAPAANTQINAEPAAPAVKKAVIYSRVSTEEQAKGGVSIDMQAEKLRHLAEVHDMLVVETISDPGFSGKNLHRPGMEKLLALARDGAMTHILIYKLDRLSRSIRDISQMIELFISQGISLVSATETIDTATPIGRMVCNIIGSFAQFERELIAERTQDAMEQMWKDGYWLTKVPFGYRREGSKIMVHDPDQAPLVLELFKTVMEQRLTVRDASRLVQIDSRFASMRRWAPSGIHRVLTSRAYLGEVLRRGKWRLGLHQPIVDVSLFDEVQRLLEGRDNVGPIGYGDSVNILAGIAVCGHCGRKLTIRAGRRRGSKRIPDPKSPRYRYYICSNHAEGKTCTMETIPAEILESAVIKKMAEVGSNRRLVESIVREIDDTYVKKTKTDRSKHLGMKTRVGTLDRKIKRLLDDLASLDDDDRSAREEMRNSLSVLSAEKKALADTMNEIEARLFIKKRERTPADLLVSLLMQPQLYLPKLTLKELRIVMKGIVAKATVWGPEKMEIDIAIPAGGSLYGAGGNPSPGEGFNLRSGLGG